MNQILLLFTKKWERELQFPYPIALKGVKTFVDGTVTYTVCCTAPL